MSEEAKDDVESAAKKPPLKRAPPLKQGAHGREQKISSLSGQHSSSKFSFGKDERPWNKKNPRSKLGSASSAPALTESTCDTDHNMSTEDSWMQSRMSMNSTWSTGFRASQIGFGAVDAIGPGLCNSTRAPRLEGSMDRFLENPDRPADPRPKSYDPAATMGSLTAVKYDYAPRWTFHGGPSRVQPFKKPHPTKVAAEAGLHASASEASDNKNEDELLKLRLKMEAFALASPGIKPKKKKLSRGFGTQPRLQIKGGVFQQPITPGPCAYDTSREFDAVPDWVNAAILPWGKRSGQRPQIINPTSTDAGPGEHMADYPFRPEGPTPYFGQHVRELTKDNYPAPCTYTIATSVGQQPSNAMVETGKRSQLANASCAPGPGTYEPKIAGEPKQHVYSFGYSTRGHITDEIDPDEPPGPGTHEIKSTLLPGKNCSLGVGLPKDRKLKKMGGMGPDGPGPGTYKPQVDPMGSGKSAPIGIVLPRKVKEVAPPVGTHDPKYTLIDTAHPNPGAFKYTAPRKSPFDVGPSEGAGGEAEALMRRAVDAADVEAEQLGYTQHNRAKALEFPVTAPRWSFGARRPMGRANDNHTEPTMMGTASSIG